MAEAVDAVQNSVKKYQFKAKSDAEKQKLLEEKDKKNTQRATQGTLRQLAEFLAIKELPELKDIADEQLPKILIDFYCEMKPQKEDKYATQSMKCKRAAMNRHFKAERSLDIIKNPMFVRTNEMFKGVLVDAKKSGKGVKRSYPKIMSKDLQASSAYFDVDHMNNPNPKILQQHLLFYVIYFFCRHGRENLYQMRKDTFKVIVEPDGTEYVIQNIDKADKNHGPDDTNETNEGRMYGNPGKNKFH